MCINRWFLCRMLGPPMSLQELLERQWEQTAQFIIHQAGQQNNGKVMGGPYEGKVTGTRGCSLGVL